MEQLEKLAVKHMVNAANMTQKIYPHGEVCVFNLEYQQSDSCKIPGGTVENTLIFMERKHPQDVFVQHTKMIKL